MFGDEMLAFQITRLADTDFKVEGFSKDDFWSDFVYHFDIPFQKGMNTIRHSYTYRGGTSVDFAESFGYQITTGKRWANKEIGEFQLEIDMGNAFFFVPNSFTSDETSIDWKINGIGKIKEQKDELLAGEFSARHVRTTTGILHYSATHFKPDLDLFFGVVQPYFQPHYWVEDLAVAEKLDRIYTAIATMPDSMAIAELDNEDLRIARNFWYAWNGYQFKDESLNKLFRQCAWYIADPSITIEKINLSPAEKLCIDWILAEEKRRK
jgi:YARHG domain